MAPPPIQQVDRNGIRSFAHAAAGHKGTMTNETGELFFKPSTQKEIDFYTEVTTRKSALLRIMPGFLGTMTLDAKQNAAQAAGVQTEAAAKSIGTETKGDAPATPRAETKTPAGTIPEEKNGNGGIYGKAIDSTTLLVLENLTDGFSHPNVLDIKLGARLWDDDAPNSKRARLDSVAQQTTSQSLHFRVAGMRIWTGPSPARFNFWSPSPWLTRPKDMDESGLPYISCLADAKDVAVFTKHYGRSLKEADFPAAFVRFLLNAQANVDLRQAKLVMKFFLTRVKLVEKILKDSETCMYSPSILFVYEGDGAAFHGKSASLGSKLDQVVNDEVEEGDDDNDDDDGGDEFEDAHSQAPSYDEIRSFSNIEEAMQAIAEKVQLGSSSAAEVPPSNISLDTEAEYEEEEEAPSLKLFDCKLIDFAHARFADGQAPDVNVIKGVTALIKKMEEVLAALEKDAGGQYSRLLESKTGLEAGQTRETMKKGDYLPRKAVE